MGEEAARVCVSECVHVCVREGDRLFINEYTSEEVYSERVRSMITLSQTTIHETIFDHELRILMVNFLTSNVRSKSQEVYTEMPVSQLTVS